MKRLGVPAIIWGVLWAIQPLKANLHDNYGFGAAKTGTAGAGMAVVNDWSSPMYNISGMAAPPLLPQRSRLAKKSNAKSEFQFAEEDQDPFVRRPKAAANAQSKTDLADDDMLGNAVGSQIGFGFMSQFAGMNLDLNKNAADSVRRDAGKGTSNLNSYAWNFGFVFDLRHLINTIGGIPVRFGLAVATNADGTIARINDLSQEAYNFKRMGREVQRLSLITGSAWQVWPNRLSIGFGLNNVAVTKGKIRVTDAQLAVSDGQNPKTQSQIDAGTTSAIVTGLTYRHPIGKSMSGSFGFTYRQQTYVRSDVDVETVVEIGNLGATTKARQLLVTYFTPHIFGTGFGFVKNRYKAVLDLEYQMWSDYFLSKNRRAFEQEPNFNDIVVVRLGGESPVNPKWPLILRVGYSFVPAITPDQSRRANYLDNDKHIIGLGAGYTFAANRALKGPTRLDLGLQYQLWSERKTKKNGNVASSLQPDYRYSGDIIIMNFSATFILNNH